MGEYAFRVDTGLFRELGEFLVGRDSTALMELVKNSYDADATKVVLDASGLAESGGTITVEDDGIGMTIDEFQDGFLTIAGRSRLEGECRSAKYGRRYSGAKGVGRLAAHKLSSELRVQSQADEVVRGERHRPNRVSAAIDWDVVEQYSTIESIERGIDVTTSSPRGNPGTRIVLGRLRRKWSATQIRRFLAELEGFRLPLFMTRSPAPDMLSDGLLFDEPTIATKGDGDPGFRLETTGDFAVGEDYWADLGRVMSWVVEVDATAPVVVVAIAPTKNRLKGRSTSARRVDATFAHPSGSNGPFFQARFFIRERAYPGSLRELARRSSGIRVYHEGFRVLPYGEHTDDWLGLDREYVSRPRRFEIEPESSDEELVAREREGFYSLGNPQYAGAVFITQEQAGGLEMVVSREGFVPNASFEAVRSIMHDAVHLSVRARAAVGARDKAAKAKAQRSEVKVPQASTIGELLVTAKAKAEEMLSQPLDRPVNSVAAQELADLTIGLASEFDRLRDEQALIRVLASVGSEMASFVHEINAIVAQVHTVQLLTNRLSEFELGDAKKTHRHLDAAAKELVGLLERQSSYIVDVLGVDARGRRSAQRVARRLQSVVDALAPAASSRQVELTVRVDDSVKTPAMYPAEVSVVLQNLLTNAIKAAGTPGNVLVEAKSESKLRRTTIAVQNSGRRVDLAEAEKWFEPFESTTTDPDPLLGQGMGLGLGIVRATVEDYGGSVHFVEPAEGFRTAVRVALPHGTRNRSGGRR